MINEELKPCPFCGSEAKYIHDESYGYYDNHIICCGNDAFPGICPAQRASKFSTKKLAITAWNTRQYEAGLQEVCKVKSGIKHMLDHLQYVKNQDEDEYYRIDIIIKWLKELTK